MLYGLVEGGQIRSGYTFKRNYEKKFMNLDSRKRQESFSLDNLFHAYFNSGYAHGSGKKNQLFTVFHLVEKNRGFSIDGIFRLYSSTGELFNSCSLYLRFPHCAY